MIYASKFRFPFEPFVDSRDGWKVLDSEAAGGIGIIFLLAGLIEVQTPDGDFKDPAGIATGNYAPSFELRNAEIAHCRMAMSAVLTLWAYEYFGDKTPSEVW